MTLLDVRDLKVHFPLGPDATLHAVDGVSFAVEEGDSFGIVGESGSGKSTTAQALMRLVGATSGTITLQDRDLTRLQGAELRHLRHLVQMVFQDPYSSLNPRLRAGAAVREPLDLMHIGKREEREQRVDDLFAAVGLHPDAKRLFPHQFSGGQRQRLCIARAIASRPRLVVCDEPVSALDVAIQAQILNLLRRLQQDQRLTYVFISHDLAVIQHICTHVAVMYSGQFVEKAPVRQLFSAAKHPYTWSLMAAALSPDDRRREESRFTVTGEPPSPINPSSTACRFSSRCPFATDRCRTEKPVLKQIGEGHEVACHYAETLTPPMAELQAA